MNRMDERKQTGASMARSAGEAHRKIDDQMADEDEMDTGKGFGGAGDATTPARARADEAPIARGRVSREADDPEHQAEEESTNASLARAPSGTKRAETKYMAESHSEELGERGTVRGGREITKKKVDADHVIGDGGEMQAKTAEGYADMASAKANRKEAMEPEREMQEQVAMGGHMGKEPNVAHKNTMGHGERETIAKHTI